VVTWTIHTPGSTQWTVLSLRGELDLYAVDELRRPVLTAIAAHGPWLAVDLTAVNFIDTTGLGMLVRLLNKLREKNGDLALIGPRGQVKRILQWTNLNRLFPVFDSAAAIPEPARN